MKILIISDTHRKHENLLKVLERECPVDLLIHLGDAEGYEDYIAEQAGCPGVEQGEVYGVLDEHGEWAYVIGSVFRRAAEDAGFSSTALLSWLRERGLIQTRGRNNTRGKRVNGVLTECVVMRLSQEQEPDDFEEI